ncbi:MAG: hypothetical protein QGH60_04370 [Phycisphaerae bacterium]|jgi:hypothetical protein|nr:hypothetical protein [Phycisphaerae bacterium]
MHRLSITTVVATAVIIFTALCSNIYAQQKASPEDMQKRITSLEKQVSELIGVVKAQGKALKAAQADRETFVSQAKFDEACANMMEDAATRGPKSKGFNLWSTVDVQLYGKIKLDAAYDSGRANTGNFARWVNPGEKQRGDGQFNMTANETRLGLKFTGPQTKDLKTNGLLEMDFYGGGGETSPNPRLRHAFLNLEWPKKKLSVLAGQTWDVISPLNPGTLNYTVLWWGGNIGMRRPQVRVTKGCALNDDTELTLQGALLRTMGSTSGFDPGDTGEDAGFPSVQGRAALKFPLFGKKKSTVGVSGHFGQEEYDINAAGDNHNVYSWSGNIDACVPVNNWLMIKAEAFTGRNLAAYAGGIGQGVNVVGTDVSEIKSSGGWLAACMKPCDKWMFNVGASGEIITGGVTVDGTRTTNSCVFGNVIYEFNKHASVGFELSNWHTEYRGASDGNDIRAQTSFIYKF